MVARDVRDVEAAGSNPVTPTKKCKVSYNLAFLFYDLNLLAGSTLSRAQPFCRFTTFPLTGESPVTPTRKSELSFDSSLFFV